MSICRAIFRKSIALTPSEKISIDDQSNPINQSIHQSINQSINQSLDDQSNQSINDQFNRSINRLDRRIHDSSSNSYVTRDQSIDWIGEFMIHRAIHTWQEINAKSWTKIINTLIILQPLLFLSETLQITLTFLNVPSSARWCGDLFPLLRCTRTANPSGSVEKTYVKEIFRKERNFRPNKRRRKIKSVTPFQGMNDKASHEGWKDAAKSKTDFRLFRRSFFHCAKNCPF